MTMRECVKRHESGSFRWWRSAWMFLLLLEVFSDPASGQAVCPASVSTVLVETHNKRLHLCQDAKVLATYPVALGRGGVGKRSYRDAKTPLGPYSLESPRPSERFHVFIPIGYPTDQQRKQGYSGQDVGIHGQTRRFAWAGRLNTLFGWTEGCVAVGTDKEIDEIADWVRKNRVKTIEIQQ